MKTQTQLKNAFLTVVIMILLAGNGVVLAQSPVNSDLLIASNNVKPEDGFQSSINDFNVSILENTAFIKWTVTGETSKCMYIIERSSDGSNYQSILFKEGVPSPTKDTELMYCLKDNTPMDNSSFYRIKQVRSDGSVNIQTINVINNTASTYAANNTR